MHKARFVASRKTERHYCKETRLKRYCKNIDITDRNFIEKAVFKCLDTRMDRRDTMKLLSEQGLVIGSYLNKNLASYYLSVAYHYVTEQCYKERRGKRKRLLSHALWYADDCILIGKDLRDLKMCQRKYEKFLKEKLHVEVKPNTKVIDLKTGYIDIVGFKISRKNATMRASNFRRIRKNLKRINQYTADNIPLHEARAFNSRTGSFKHLDMLQYIKDNNIIELLDSCNNTIRAKTERRTICEKWYSIQNRTALK